jgi:hypothetical protein
MGIPNPAFPPARGLSATEAGVLADDVMARAQAALRRGAARPLRRPPSAVARALLPGIAPWFECLTIGVCAFACVAGYAFTSLW